MSEAEERCAQALLALEAVAAALEGAQTAEEALSQALERMLDVLHVQAASIHLLDGPTGQIRSSVVRGASRLLAPLEGELTPCQTVGGPAAEERNAPAAGLPAGLHRVSRCVPTADGLCLSMPLTVEGRTVGLLQLARTHSAGFAETDHALLHAIGALLAEVAENLRLREEVRRAEALSALVQEMHHRIKNNLQTVADLLSLEMSASPSPAARKSLRDSITRIKSIAAVHELLSLEHLRLTDITELARQVCDISLRHLVHPMRRVSAEINGPAIYLPSKQATALALVMNELIANALEHAFNLAGHEGRLTITTAQDGARVTVAIEDNGQGLPADFDLQRRRGLGLQIVQTLVEKDLAGTLHLENRPGGGSRATLTFYK